MTPWPNLDASLNAIVRDTFGEPVVYQPMRAGAPNGAPLTISVVRQARIRDEAGPAGSFEEIMLNPTDLPALPLKGDSVAAWGGQYTVVVVHQPDPYGLVLVTMQRQNAQP
jgi:hypothetical protein